MDKAKARFAAWDAAETIHTAEDAILTLDAALQDGDPALINSMLGAIARSKGMTAIAEETGLGRESLYKALSETGNPSFANALAVLRACGLRLRVETIDSAA